MGKIPQYWLEIKTFAEELVTDWALILVVLIAVCTAFGLGRLSVLIEAKPLVSVSEAQTAAAAGPLRVGGHYVASRNGSVYYFPWCGGAQNIAVQNQRWFSSAEEAERAGYRPAKNCRGLSD